jgi:hypothetical protein
MAAPYNPDLETGTRGTLIFGRVYHWTWAKRAGRPAFLRLHPGEPKNCRRSHLDERGMKRVRKA